MKPLIDIAREKADMIPLGSTVTYNQISHTLNSIPEKHRLSFGLYYVEYIRQREDLKMSPEDEAEFIDLKYRLIDEFIYRRSHGRV